MSLSRTAKRQMNEAARDVYHFAKWFIGITLYPYQRQAAEEIARSVFEGDGRTFVLIFSRQSGKDEVLAILVLFIMLVLSKRGCDIVCAQPTFKPQTINAMERIKKRSTRFGKSLSRTAGYIFHFGMSRASYFSAEPSASQVGATASHLLIMNEAQDILPAVFDKRFSFMAASGNATRVFSGTSWTSNTLLAREKYAALEQEKKDGKPRVFIVDADKVGKANKRYKSYMQSEIRKHGRAHPFIKTQLFCEEIDAEASMFNAGRLALMQADQPPQDAPTPGVSYAFLIDAAGQDEGRMNDPEAELTNAARDSVALSIISIELTSLELLGYPIYRVINRQKWTGLNHVAIFGKLAALADAWQPQYIVIDATGVGEGLYGLLDHRYPTKVIPVKFSQQQKSEIGWMFLSAIETGRFRLCVTSKETELQYTSCQSEILPGPAKILRWGVPDGTRNPQTGDIIHDDDVMADALCTQLDKLDWTIPYKPFTIHTQDPLETSHA